LSRVFIVHPAKEIWFSAKRERVLGGEHSGRFRQLPPGIPIQGK
jgi:hypothetical protein